MLWPAPPAMTQHLHLREEGHPFEDENVQGGEMVGEK